MDKEFNSAALVGQLGALNVGDLQGDERREVIEALAAAVDQLGDIDLAEVSALLLLSLETKAKGAMPHRARTDLFCVGLGEAVSVDQVNAFLVENAGKPLEVHEKIQLAKVIQELMSSGDVELWETIGDYQYQRRISTAAHKKTRRFIFDNVSLEAEGDAKLPKRSACVSVPCNVQLIPK